METLSTESLKPNSSYTGDLLLDSSFLLLPKGADVTESLIKALKLWNVENILCDGNLSIGGELEENGPELEPSAIVQKKDEKISVNIKKVIENSKQSVFDNSEKARLNAVHDVYEEYMNYIERVFTHYSTHKVIDQADLSDAVQQLCIFIKENRRYILRIASNPKESDRNFIVIHAIRTTVIAIAIAQQLKMPLSKMVDLGVTCILHEIGMLRLPPQLYNTSKKLTAGQRAQISRHTVFGYTIIKDLNFPIPVQLGVLEHHEKENGLGYPRRLPGEKIEPIAKIISVACSYEAISSPRTYKDERTTFDALLEMIQNREKAYDDVVLKALLYSVSLYPIGTYVYLSNRKIGVVIDSNQINPKWPIVQMITEKEADGTPKTVQTSPGLSILRILSKQEKEDILKVVETKENAMDQAKKIAENNAVPELEDAETKPAVQKARSIGGFQKVPVSAGETSSQGGAKKSGDGTEEVDISEFE
ncbi:HD-GYP domain-containing protein [Treponema sp. C6A8]|uniref:HD-GYP domain-containing protein n=1 Tax=Treponema sp. C6A8 TaxID=1410609 RepID=UPI000481A036|nr:HD domain-containing phosphohydrolase [Treponema sp. C6A8]